jgi:putative hydrolase of the HAD superfamily
MLKGVLFDLGSTLQEYRHEDWSATTAEINRAVYDYIHEQGHSHRLPPLDEFLEILNRRVFDRWQRAQTELKGESMLELLDALLDEHGVEELRANECLPNWFQKVSDITYVEPDTIPTLERLKASGLKLGIVSNTAWPAAAHDPDLQKFGLLHLFDCRIYSCDVGWEKPAPPIFHAALDCLGTRPEETAFVGDFRRYDIAGAHSVGMKGILKRVEGRPEEMDDPSVVPDATIQRVSDLPDVLRALYDWQN